MFSTTFWRNLHTRLNTRPVKHGLHFGKLTQSREAAEIRKELLRRLRLNQKIIEKDSP